MTIGTPVLMIGRSCLIEGKEEATSPASPIWTPAQSNAAQKACDEIFGKDGELTSLSFSFTLSDPLIEDCPLIGCSSGFSAMCGYQLQEVVGRNCRFLVDPVPRELIDQNARVIARDFCTAVARGQKYDVPDSLREPWMPAGHADDGVFCIQTNAKKDGSLFKTFFHLREVHLDDSLYILGLQTELLFEFWQDERPPLDMIRRATQACKANMTAAEKVMARHFWYESSMRRDEAPDILELVD